MNAAGKSILIIDLDKETSRQLVDVLSQEGYRAASASPGREIVINLNNLPDLIIFNPQLPDSSGLDFLRSIKQKPELTDVSVFILSSKETETDEIISLEVGADDYIAKPVQIPRLLARVRALFRRRDEQRKTQESEVEVITIDDLSILIQQYAVVYGNEHVDFSKKEFEILVQLAKNYGRVMTREALFHTIWGHHDNSTNRTIDVHIGRIRKKLKGYAHYIETVPGVGYRFQENQTG